MNREFGLGLFIIVLLTFGTFLYVTNKLEKKEKFNGFYMSEDIDNFALKESKGNTVSISDFRGKIVLLYFGYTSCPDICPNTMSVLRKTYTELGKRKDKVQVIFITVDPERDTFEKLQVYVPHFHKDFLALRGSEEELRKVGDIFKIHYFKEDTDSGIGYLMSHPTSVYLLDRNGRLLLKYPHTVNSDMLLEDIEKLI